MNYIIKYKDHRVIVNTVSVHWYDSAGLFNHPNDLPAVEFSNKYDGHEDFGGTLGLYYSHGRPVHQIANI